MFGNNSKSSSIIIILKLEAFYNAIFYLILTNNIVKNKIDYHITGCDHSGYCSDPGDYEDVDEIYTETQMNPDKEFTEKYVNKETGEVNEDGLNNLSKYDIRNCPGGYCQASIDKEATKATLYKLHKKDFLESKEGNYYIKVKYSLEDEDETKYKFYKIDENYRDFIKEYCQEDDRINYMAIYSKVINIFQKKYRKAGTEKRYFVVEAKLVMK